MKKSLFPIENKAFSLRVLCIRAGSFPEGRGGRFAAFRRRLAFFPFRVRVFPRIRATELVVYGRLGGSFSLF